MIEKFCKFYLEKKGYLPLVKKEDRPAFSYMLVYPDLKRNQNEAE